MNNSNLKTLLKTLQSEFSRILGDRLDDILLFGSRARGDAELYSDIDILVIIKDDFDYECLIRETSEVVSNLSLENDIVISRVFISKEYFEHGNSPFLSNVRREGIKI